MEATREHTLRSLRVRAIIIAFAGAVVLAFALSASGATTKVPLHIAIVGHGKVTGSPRISCAKTCTARIARGTVVRLLARPAKGWRLNRWTGVCSGRTRCAVTMRGARTVRAIFVGPRPQPVPPSQTTPQLWVDANGGSCTRHATGSGYSDGQACGSFQAAYDAAQCGDTVGVTGGNYGSVRIGGGGKTCSATTPVTFSGSAGAACTNNAAASIGAFTLSVGYVRLHCLNANPDGLADCAEISGRSGHAAAPWDSLDHVSVHCLFIDADHLHVTNTTFGPDEVCRTGQEDMIVFRANRDSIDDVVFDHVTFATVSAPPDVQCGRGLHVDTIQGYGVSNLRISNSIFYGCPGQCIIFRPFNGGTPGPITIENTIFNEPQDPGQAIDIGSSSSSDGDRCNGPILIQNNTFVNGAAFHGGCWNNPSVVVRNNIMTGSSCNFGGSGDTYTNNVFYDSRSCGANARRCRPAFVQSTSSVTSPGNFHLAPTDTCAKGAASQSPGSFPGADIDGQQRPMGAVDAGADEIG